MEHRCQRFGLPGPVLPKRQWPKVKFKTKRALTLKEHQAILASEANRERRAFYAFCWHLGGAQSDVAAFTAEDINWRDKVVGFRRQKAGTTSVIRFGDELEERIRPVNPICSAPWNWVRWLDETSSSFGG